MIQLRELDLITYRAPLAFHFTDAATNQPVDDGLHLTAWPYAPGHLSPARQVVTAEKSLQSALYGFPSWLGLERYQRGDEMTPASRQFVIQIEDAFGRFLPQTHLVALPLATPQVQEILLFSAPTRAILPGYTTIRGDLYHTTPPTGAPPLVRISAPASWARVILTVADITIQTFADDQGRFLCLAPYPALPATTLLAAVAWSVTLRVAHNPTALATDLALLTAARPELESSRTPPFQTTLAGQADASLFNNVTVVDAAAGSYAVIGPTDATSASFTYSLGRSLIMQTQIEGGPDHLAEFLLNAGA